jgi:hypothetical protein
MMLLIYAALAVSAAAWLVAAISAIQLWGLRADDYSGWDLVWNGMAWFRVDTFKPVAAPLHSRFLWAFMAFFAGLLAAAALLILSHL